MNNAHEHSRPLKDIAGDLAQSLRDVIEETDESYLEKNPEDAYVDLACRLILRISKNELAICPAAQVIAAKKGAAAARILDLFTVWLREESSKRHYITSYDFDSGKFEIHMRASGETKGYFRGVTVQDAYGQAAQTLEMNGGEL